MEFMDQALAFSENQGLMVFHEDWKMADLRYASNAASLVQQLKV